MTKHTPAPWAVLLEVDDLDSSATDLRVVDSRSMDHPQGPLTLATINVAAFAPHLSEPLANAALIASAPELLSALQWALDQIDDSLDPDHQAALSAIKQLVSGLTGPSILAASVTSVKEAS